MKIRNRLIVFAAAGLVATGAWAQHDEHHQADAPTTAETPKPEKAPGMAGSVMAEMPQMIMAHHAEVAKLVDQLMTSFAAIQTEQNQTALKKKLDAHAALLKELQTKMQGEAHMADMMKQMMGDAGVSKTPGEAPTPSEHQH